MEYYIVINIIFPLRESWHSVKHAVCRVRAPCVWTLNLREEKRNVMNGKMATTGSCYCL